LYGSLLGQIFTRRIKGPSSKGFGLQELCGKRYFHLLALFGRKPYSLDRDEVIHVNQIPHKKQLLHAFK
jgi:hypothetical protein